MRILHTADWHLGKLVYGVSMLEDQEAFLEETLYPVIEQERPDCLVLSGDIFDRSIAPPQAIRLFEACVLKLCKTYRLPLLAISGNHDGADRIAPAAQLLREQGVYIATKIEDAFSPIALEKDGTAYHFHLLPYFEPAELRTYYKNEEIRGFSEAYRAASGHIAQGFDKKAVHILCAHCFVTGCTVSDSESPIYVGGSGEVSASLFEPFDLTLLGLGEDAHTASLFPGTGAVFDEGLTTVVRPPGKGTRLSLTAATLSRSRTVVFLVQGEGKREALARTLEPDENPNFDQTPARAIRAQNDLLWLTDVTL